MDKDKNEDRLLKILYERLDIAMDFEREKKVVIPETSYIIKDIMKLRGIEVNDKKQKNNDFDVDFEFK